MPVRGPAPRRPILVLSAWEPELAPLRRALAAAPSPVPLVLRPVGVGAVDAAAGAATAVAAHRPRAVVFVGTAGLYPGAGLPLGTGHVAVARKLHLPSTAALRGDGYLPTPMIVEAATDARLRAALRRGAAAPLADVASPLAVTRRLALARRLAAATGSALENLETFAVARAVAAVPFAAVLGVANAVGPRAHAQWRRHHEAASAAACAVVARWLSAGAPLTR